MQSALRARAVSFLEFVNASGSPFHAVENCKSRLIASGFREVMEGDNWKLERGGKYFFTRNHSTIIAFTVGGQFLPGVKGGFKIIGVHTDSPCLKVRPISAQQSQGFLQVGVSLYGGGLWHTWFDRDLTVAGRAILKDQNGSLSQKLVSIGRPILRVPNLAIHLQSVDERAAFKFNQENHLQPVLASAVKANLEAPTEAPAAGADKPRHHPIFLQLLSEALGCSTADIKDFELCLLDAQPSCLIGAKEEFISSPRLDNLMSTFCAVEAMTETCGEAEINGDEDVRIMAAFDHEEIGSESVQGAASLLMTSTLERILSTVQTGQESPADAFAATMRRSFMISADMAHGVHPNYAEKHQEHFRPQLQKGVVLKHNANQRYATDSIGASLIRELAAKNDIPIQEFTVKNDSPCGSTIGPLLSARTGVKTVDMGMPQLSMHSIREMCGVDDVTHQINLFKVFYSQFRDIPETLTHV
eukprot:GILK01002110.1.p1 GENE.GILK01002110.1~~GILK01002110.1.p1  ORF type:complete len:472 (-),score=100.07 GILK01002110.1:122-1537(-)